MEIRVLTQLLFAMPVRKVRSYVHSFIDNGWCCLRGLATKAESEERLPQSPPFCRSRESCIAPTKYKLSSHPVRNCLLQMISGGSLSLERVSWGGGGGRRRGLARLGCRAQGVCGRGAAWQARGGRRAGKAGWCDLAGWVEWG